MPRFWTSLIIAITLGAAGLLWSSSLPLGVPGEWTGNRIPYEAATAALLLPGLLFLALAGVICLGVIHRGAQALEAASARSRAAWLAALLLAGNVWLFALQNAAPSPFATEKLSWVQFYPGSSGYFHTACYEIRETGEFLRTYEQRMAKGDVLHEGTHPPGLFLLHRGIISLCAASPRLTELLLATEPEAVRQASDVIENHSRFSDKPLRKPARAALWLAALLTQLISTATCLPLFALLRRSCSPGDSWRLAALWLFVPALAIFQPNSDALYPFLTMLFLWLWVRGLDCRSWLSAVLAGVVFWTGMFCSLAFLPVAALAVLLTVGHWRQSEQPRITLPCYLSLVGLAVAGCLLPVGLLWGLVDLNLFVIWDWNYHNHAGFYDQYPRTWSYWLAVNPLELGFALGFPVALLSLGALGQRGTNLLDRWLVRSVWLVWGLLWLSGKNSGEAARLWLLLYPTFLWTLAVHFPPTGPASSIRWRVLALQAFACVTTVLRVTGFHFMP